MANQRPDQLTAQTAAGTAATDLFLIYDLSAATLKKMTPSEIATLVAADIPAASLTLSQISDAGTMAAEAAASYLPLVAGGASVENIGAVESNVETDAAVTTTKAMDLSTYGVFDYTMTGNTTFSFSNPAPSGKASTWYLLLSGAFTPTFPAACVFDAGTQPTYATPTLYVFTTLDGGTTVFMQAVGTAFA